MTVIPPFTSTAKTTLPFIPPAQDADKLKRERLAEIEQREQAIERSEQALADKADAIDETDHRDAVADLDAQRVGVQTLRAALAVDLEDMRAQFSQPQQFFLQVPTSVEREQINSRLIMLGLQHITAEVIRATMIEELFNVDWTPFGETKLDENANLTIAEQNADFLDSVWMRQQAHDVATSEWTEQEVERIKDHLNGAPLREQAPQPIKVISVREQARMQILIDRMMQRPRLRSLAAVNMDYGRQNAMLLVRMHLVGVDFVPPMPIERDPRDNALPEAAVAALREVVDDKSWTQLVTFIDELYVVSEAERKNSVLPPERQSLLDGLTERSVSPAGSGGSSTGSDSTPAPAAASETIIDRSFSSTSASDQPAASTAASPSPMAVP